MPASTALPFLTLLAILLAFTLFDLVTHVRNRNKNK